MLETVERDSDDISKLVHVPKATNDISLAAN